MDTVLAKVKSLQGNNCTNIYTQGKFTQVVPMMASRDAGLSLIDFTDDVGIPDILVTLLTSQELISLLKPESQNIHLISVTLLTSQEPISWLK